MNRVAGAVGEVEPYTARELTTFLQSLGCTVVRQSGSHIFMRTKTGERVGSAGQGAITSALARQNARALGMSYPEFREAIGYPVVKSGKTSKGKARDLRSSPMPSKSATRAVISECRSALDALDRATFSGQRDSAFYGRILPHLSQARACINRAAQASGVEL